MNYAVIEDERSIWGKLYLPAKNTGREGEGLRVALFGSTNAGVLVLESLQKLSAKLPGMIVLRGVATDDPLDPKTRISVQKRIWKYYNEPEMKNLRQRVIETAVNNGIPCYTGDVKTDYFREILKDWDPELIIMCCFGQKVDEKIFQYPALGMYNFHPSDLAANIGIGPQPFHAAISSNHSTSVMTVHQVNEIIDRGPIVGNSPEVNITKADGSYPVNILTLQEKIPSICGWLSIELVLEAIRLKEAGLKESIKKLDFRAVIPDSIKQKLMEPATDDLSEGYILPLHHSIC